MVIGMKDPEKKLREVWGEYLIFWRVLWTI